MLEIKLFFWKILGLNGYEKQILGIKIEMKRKVQAVNRKINLLNRELQNGSGKRVKRVFGNLKENSCKS